MDIWSYSLHERRFDSKTMLSKYARIWTQVQDGIHLESDEGPTKHTEAVIRQWFAVSLEIPTGDRMDGIVVAWIRSPMSRLVGGMWNNFHHSQIFWSRGRFSKMEEWFRNYGWRRMKPLRLFLPILAKSIAKGWSWRRDWWISIIKVNVGVTTIARWS